MKILVTLTTETETFDGKYTLHIFQGIFFFVYLCTLMVILRNDSADLLQFINILHESIIMRYNVPALALMLVRQSIILVNTAFT